MASQGAQRPAGGPVLWKALGGSFVSCPLARRRELVSAWVHGPGRGVGQTELVRSLRCSVIALRHMGKSVRLSADLRPMSTGSRPAASLQRRRRTPPRWR